MTTITTLPVLNMDIHKTTILEVYEWEEVARKQEWYQEIHSEWIDIFSDYLKGEFLKKVEKIETTPFLSYLKTPGWNEYDFMKVYKFPEFKINFSEYWFRKNHPEQYQELMSFEDDGTIGAPQDPDNFSGPAISIQTLMNIEKITGFYQNLSTSEERKDELMVRFPSIRHFLNNRENRFTPENMILHSQEPTMTMNGFLDFFFETYQRGNRMDINKIFRMKKYSQCIEIIKKYHLYSMFQFNRILTEKIENFFRIYIELFYESNSLDTVMSCITSKHITIDMIEEHFDDIMIYYVKSREMIFENPNVNMEIYEKWIERMKTVQLVFPFDSIQPALPTHFTFEMLIRNNSDSSNTLYEFVDLSIERTHWINRRFQIRFVESYMPESILKHKILEYL